MTETNSTAIKTIWLALLVIIFDQLTKMIAVSTLEFGIPVAVMPNLNWTLAYNYGAAFSFLADMGGWQRWFFIALAVVISAGLTYWLSKLPNKLDIDVWGINLVLGGAIGNVIDRNIEGRVTDFIDFYIGTWHYATFNIADVAITVGAALLIISEFFFKKNADEQSANKDKEPSESSKS